MMRSRTLPRPSALTGPSLRWPRFDESDARPQVTDKPTTGTTPLGSRGDWPRVSHLRFRLAAGRREAAHGSRPGPHLQPLAVLLLVDMGVPGLVLDVVGPGGHLQL